MHYPSCHDRLLFLRLAELGENLNNKVNQVVRCKRLKINETLYSVNESDPRSNVHYLGSSENKA